MNKWTKIGIAVGAGVATIAATHVINKIIFSTATAGKITDSNVKMNYNWKFGNISYTVSGDGSPVLLMHNLSSSSSSYEWNNVIKDLSKNHKVYAIDLLGCGYSDKPNITYTAYMYTQLVNDFIVNVICKKTTIIASNTSAPLAILSAYCNPYVIKDIILVNPQGINDSMKAPDKYADIRKKLLLLPVIGTTIYNICNSKNRISKNYSSRFKSSNNIEKYTDASYEIAHLGGSSAKYLFTSTVCKHTTCSMIKALKELNNSIYIISGNSQGSKDIADEYTLLNPAIETIFIENSNQMPHIEQPEEFIKNVNIFISK